MVVEREGEKMKERGKKGVCERKYERESMREVGERLRKKVR